MDPVKHKSEVFRMLCAITITLFYSIMAYCVWHDVFVIFQSMNAVKYQKVTGPEGETVTAQRSVRSTAEVKLIPQLRLNKTYLTQCW